MKNSNYSVEKYWEDYYRDALKSLFNNDDLTLAKHLVPYLNKDELIDLNSQLCFYLRTKYGTSL